MWAVLTVSLTAGAASLRGEEGADKSYTLSQTGVGFELKAPDGRTVFQYMTVKPEGSGLTANSTCCFYPVFTPKGTRVVDFAPDDHPHHRGIFLAWHNMQGEPGGDFWGWGEHAPTEGRVIRNKSVALKNADAEEAVMEVRNEWMADETVLIEELLTATVRAAKEAHVIDLHYALTPQRDLTLGQTAFSGFNVKSRKAASVYSDPEGEVERAQPHHLKPETDWPARPWYDYTFTLEDGTQAGVSVIDHKDNPPTLWHNLQPIAMVNPCIVAPAAVKLEAEKPLHLRYRLVVHDGPLPKEVVAEQAKDYARE